MKRFVLVVFAQLLVLSLVTPAAAVEDPGTIAGTVLSTSGRPALGARVFAGDQWSYVQADGSFSISVRPATYSIHVFQGTIGIEAADYPYEELHTSTQYVVESGRTTRVNLTLPLKDNAPPEFGAVAGNVSTADGPLQWTHVAYLIDQDGNAYGGFTDDLGNYIVGAPAGAYRLFVHSNSSIDSYLGQFYGEHPRGYALDWDEAEVLVIPGPGDSETDRDVILAAGDYSRFDQYTGGSISVPQSTPDFEYGVSASYVGTADEFARIGRPDVDSQDAPLEDYSIFVYPGIKSPSPGSVTLFVADSVYDPLLYDQIQVWLDFHLVPDCDGGTTAPCVQERRVISAWDGDTVAVAVAIEDGGVLMLGDRPQFYDSRDSVFSADILWLAGSGITKGCSEAGDVFCPNDPVTRGQMAAFLVRGLGLSDSLNDPFTDDDGSIFEPAIEKLAAAGITRGCNPPVNDQFCPNASVTRGQMAAFLVRALGYTDSGEGNLFADDDGSVFEENIDRLATAGVTRGCNPPVNDRFCPNDVVTRGQMAAFLHRALG